MAEFEDWGNYPFPRSTVAAQAKALSGALVNMV